MSKDMDRTGKLAFAFGLIALALMIEQLLPLAEFLFGRAIGQVRAGLLIVLYGGAAVIAFAAVAHKEPEQGGTL